MDQTNDGYANAQEAIARLRTERLATFAALMGLPDADCGRKVEWWGRPQSVNQRLRAFTAHALDHYQHLHRLLQARGRYLSEAQLLLIQSHAMLAQFEALVLSLPDAEFDAPGVNPGDWSARQVVEHVIENERLYRENIVAGLAGPAAPAAPDPSD